MMTSSIFSKGLYSNWCYNQSLQVLFDAGEGCATHIANSLNGIENIFIGHDHGDHTLGLPSILGCRNAGRGVSRNPKTMDHNKPLKIYFPEDNRLMGGMIDFCEARYGNWLRYPVEFIPINDGFETQISPTIWLRAFSMKHQKGQTTLGYVLFEKRNRLLKAYQGLDGKDLAQLKKNGTQIHETYRHNVFAYCLDSCGIYDPTQIKDCEQVVMDCTFINEKDRTDMTHFTLDEASKLCQDMGVKKMYAAHFSIRNDYNQAVKEFPNINFVNPYIVNTI